MDRMTKEQIKAIRSHWNPSTEQFHALCDLALQALESVSSEIWAWWKMTPTGAVAFVGKEPPDKINIWSPLYRAMPSKVERDEAVRNSTLENALRRLYKFTFNERWASKGFDQDAQELHDLVERALKREPSAAPQENLKGSEAPHTASSHRPDATPAVSAPDVAIVLSQLEGIAKHMRAAYPKLEGDAYWLDQAAALLARLGQGLSCPRPQIMGAHACKDRTQCWEPCGDLGQHEEYARPAPGASDE